MRKHDKTVVKIVNNLDFRVISSAVEQLVYTEKVGGSIPSSPTTLRFNSTFFCYKNFYNFGLSVFMIIALTSCGRKNDPILNSSSVPPYHYPPEKK